MPDPGDTYRREVIQARFEYRGVPPREQWGDLTALEREVAAAMVSEMGAAAFTGTVASGQQAMTTAYAAMVLDIEDAFPDGPLTPERIESVEQGVREAMANFSVRAETILRQNVDAGSRAAIEGHQEALDRAASEAGVTISDQFILDKMDEIRGRADERREVEIDAEALLRRRTSAATDDTVGWVRGAEGRPGRDASRELLGRLTSDASGDMYDRVQEALDGQGQRGRKVRKAIQSFGRAAEDLNDDGKNLYPNAKRVVAHEQNVIFHEADVLSAQESPAIRALRWRVSHRHPLLESSPDICDVAKDADPHGLGNGLYHPGSCPSLLHPYCQCAVIPETVDPDDWGEIEYDDDQPPNEKPEVLGQDEVDAILRANLTAESGDVTAAKVERTTDLFEDRTQVPYDAFIDF